MTQGWQKIIRGSDSSNDIKQRGVIFFICKLSIKGVISLLFIMSYERLFYYGW
ncbi:hypothetical protein HMPREF1613_01133 [Escherichia coli 908616]|nr:hypothetical protein HMPREF1599_01206 [Escherichia coli 907713]ESD24640.1 hypothetical protein HMPREF1600_03174 [Escherichia coli 907715]ESD50716.1 hypothetical protein HMPREF1605_03415 [Escherichia coli 908521]ESD89008.1 hypothetical protein HMPREF1612_02667 [Escherichia coli 908585]ESD93874.1 hypothetical protein HMPREF1613_01133 [Escherichia coli 908616]KXH01951.1 hypothetical protein HMPREF3040_00954 [Escherichia coli]